MSSEEPPAEISASPIPSQSNQDLVQIQAELIAADTQEAMQQSSDTTLVPETQQDADVNLPDAENNDEDTVIGGLDGTEDAEVHDTAGAKADEEAEAKAEPPAHAATETQPSKPEPRIPVKKDVTLREFMGKMDDYAPIIPDAVTAYYLTLAGLPPPPQTSPHLTRLLALAAQKFIADVAADAYQYARIRTGHTTSNTAAANAAAGVGVGVPGVDAVGAAAAGQGKGKEDKSKQVQLGVQRPGFGGGGQGGQGQGRTVLTMEDLGMAVGEYGVNVKRGEFYR